MEDRRPRFSDLGACPTCRGAVAERGSDLHCDACGKVGRLWHGIHDFLALTPALPVASGGVFDLRKDEALAAELAPVEADYRSLVEQSARLRANRPKDAVASKADDKYAEWYWKVQREVGLQHGQAILAKLDAFLDDRGLSHPTGGTALEAGCGEGAFLPGFATRFETLVVLDCSLVNLLLAQRLAEECGHRNVLFVRGDLQHLPFRDNQFGFVHENGVIEHVQDPKAMVAEALRVLAVAGTYLCLSPNRFPITPEPHFKLPLFGAFPPAVRRVLLPRIRGLADESGTDLRSLGQLKRIFRDNGAEAFVFFLPRKLSSTARSTPVRRLIKEALASPVVGGAVNFLLNGPLLPIMPYHFAVVHRGQAANPQPH